MRGAVTKAPIAYLMRDRFIPLPDDDDNEDEYADFDQQLIARHPIIQAVHAAIAEETLEESGPRKKRLQVNGDNTVLFNLSKSVFGKTNRWNHAWLDERMTCNQLLVKVSIFILVVIILRQQDKPITHEVSNWRLGDGAAHVLGVVMEVLSEDLPTLFQVIFRQGLECVRQFLVDPLSLQQLLTLMEVKKSDGFNLISKHSIVCETREAFRATVAAITRLCIYPSVTCTPAPAPPGERMVLQILEACADVIRDNLGMESTTSVSVSLVDAPSENPMALYIALKATFVVMVLIRQTLFILHWDRGEVFSFLTLTDKLDY